MQNGNLKIVDWGRESLGRGVSGEWEEGKHPTIGYIPFRVNTIAARSATEARILASHTLTVDAPELCFRITTSKGPVVPGSLGFAFVRLRVCSLKGHPLTSRMGSPSVSVQVPFQHHHCGY